GGPAFQRDVYSPIRKRTVATNTLSKIGVKGRSVLGSSFARCNRGEHKKNLRTLTAVLLKSLPVFRREPDGGGLVHGLAKGLPIRVIAVEEGANHVAKCLELTDDRRKSRGAPRCFDGAECFVRRPDRHVEECPPRSHRIAELPQECRCPIG